MVSDSCGHASNKKLAPLDIRVGEKGASAQKGTFNGSNNNVIGGLELREGCFQACKDHQVA